MVMNKLANNNMKLLSELETKFKLFDDELKRTKTEINRKFEELNENLIVNVENKIRVASQQMANDAGNQLAELVNRLDLYQMPLNIFPLKFVRNTNSEASEFNAYTYILDRLLKQEQFYMKLKYFNMFDALKSISGENKSQELNLIDLTSTQGFYKCKKIILSRGLVFFFIEFRRRHCVMQIRSILNDFIFVTSDVIVLKLFEQYQFLGYGNRILAYYFTDETFILKMYDLDFQLLNSRRIGWRVNLHSMDDTEIVCVLTSRSKNKHNCSPRYLVFDHNLNVKYTFGQPCQYYELESPSRPFCFDNSSLIRISHQHIYAYNYNIKEELHFIQVFSKQTGKVVSLIPLERNSKKQCIQVDKFGRLIVRSTCQPLLKYYDENGKFLFQVFNKFFQVFTSLELTSKNEIFYLERNKKLFIY